jgi:aminopeptidase N
MVALHRLSRAGAAVIVALLGFVEPRHRELLMPYRERYFELVGKAWQEWTGEFAQTFAEFAYPLYAIEEETLRRTDAYLETEQPPAALHRLLIEGRAGVERALHAQARDAKG